MTYQRKTLIVICAAVLLAGGGFAWYWQATAVDRRVAALVGELQGDEGRGWWEIADDLVAIGPPAVGTMTEMLSDPDGAVREFATSVLGRIGGEYSVEPLILALTDEDPEVKRVAFEALATIGKPATDRLMGELVDKTSTVRALAAGLLGGLKDRRAIEPLTAAIQEDEDWMLRKASAIALGLLGAPESLAPLVGALEDEHVEVRFVAASALGVLQNGNAVEPLIRALDDEDPYVAGIAAHSLGELGDRKAVDALIAFAVRSAGSWESRSFAVHALGAIGDPRAIEPLERLLADPHEQVRETAEKAIMRLRARGN
jgi:HEAT repeat protein